MKKSLKIIAIVTVSLLCLVAVGLGVFLLQFDANQYKDTVVSVVKEQTGRDFAIEGDIRVAPSLLPTLVVERVRLANPDWAQEPLMLSVNRVEAQISLLSLLRGNMELRRIVLLEPIINLQARQDGQGNWQFRKGGDMDQMREQAEDKGLPQLNIHQLHVEQAEISYLGKRHEKPLHLAVPTLRAELAGLDNELKINLDARYEGSPLSIDGSVGSLAGLGSSSPYPLSLNIRAGGARGKIEGEIGNPARLTGVRANLQLQAESLAEFNEFTGSNWPDEGPLKLRADVSGDAEQLRVKSLEMRLAGSDMSGEGSLTLTAQRPRIKAQLQSNHLDLVPFQPKEKKKKQKDEKIFSSREFNLSGLQTVDADIELEANRFTTRQAQVRDLRLSLSLDKGVLAFRPRGQIAGGTMNTDFRLDAAAGQPTLDARLEIKNMLPEQLPMFAEDPIIRNGQTDIRFEGRGSGSSPSAIAGSLNGKLLVTIGNGQLMNEMANLAGADVIFSTFQMLNPLAGDEKHSELNCGVLNFDIKNGIAQAPDGIALQTDKVNVLGSGVVDLKTEQIDFRAKPRARKGLGINLAQLSDVVHIGGTLSNPRPATDVKGALRTAGTVGAAVATGGISLLAEGLFNRTFATDDPCAVALGKKEAGEETSSGAADSTEKARPAEDKNSLDKAEDTVKGLFNNLFGN